MRQIYRLKYGTILSRSSDISLANESHWTNNLHLSTFSVILSQVAGQGLAELNGAKIWLSAIGPIQTIHSQAVSIKEPVVSPRILIGVLVTDKLAINSDPIVKISVIHLL
jgi:hypothetical protein